MLFYTAAFLLLSAISEAKSPRPAITQTIQAPTRTFTSFVTHTSGLTATPTSTSDPRPVEPVDSEYLQNRGFENSHQPWHPELSNYGPGTVSTIIQACPPADDCIEGDYYIKVVADPSVARFDWTLSQPLTNVTTGTRYLVSMKTKGLANNTMIYNGVSIETSQGSEDWETRSASIKGVTGAALGVRVFGKGGNDFRVDDVDIVKQEWS